MKFSLGSWHSTTELRPQTRFLTFALHSLAFLHYKSSTYRGCGAYRRPPANCIKRASHGNASTAPDTDGCGHGFWHKATLRVPQYVAQRPSSRRAMRFIRPAAGSASHFMPVRLSRSVRFLHISAKTSERTRDSGRRSKHATPRAGNGVATAAFSALPICPKGVRIPSRTGSDGAHARRPSESVCGA